MTKPPRRPSDPGPSLPAVRAMLDEAAAGGRPALDEAGAKRILSELGIPVPRSVRLEPGQAFDQGGCGLDAPFALKALSGEAIHKSDIGAVRLGLADAGAVNAARREIAASMAAAGKPLTGLLVEEMAAPGVEIVIGGATDPRFGPMIMVGAGGIFAEILQDVSFRLCPIDARDAREMVGELRIAPILHGARGRRAADTDAICRALLVLGGEGGFFTAHADRIAEFDLNPLFARPDGLTAVDCRMILRNGAR